MPQTDAPVPNAERMFGKFYGSDKSWIECEGISLMMISANLRNKDAVYRHRKWFDYRGLHPVVCTYLFAHRFDQAYRAATAKAFDCKAGPYQGAFGIGKAAREAKEEERKPERNERAKQKRAEIKAWKEAGEPEFVGPPKPPKPPVVVPIVPLSLNIFEHSEKRAIWMLRQKADEIGCRYEFFCDAAMRVHLDRHWTRLPRPCHISTDDDMLIKIANAWHVECKTRIQMAKEEFYLAKNFFGHVDQLAFENWLVDCVKQKAHPHYALTNLIRIDKLMRPEVAVQNFGERVIQAVYGEKLG